MTARTLAPADAHKLIEEQGFTHVDVRSPGEFDQAHPSGSYNVPIAMPGPGGMSPNPEFLAAMRALFTPETALVIGCAAGGRSARACAMLEQAGFTNLVDQRAGFEGKKDPFGGVSEPGWSRAGLPVSHGPDPERGWSALKTRAAKAT